jgi:hypothetical protein
VAYRYAVLWQREGDETLPAALVIARDDHVFVDAPEEMCVPEIFQEPFVVGSINGPFPVTYTPADPQYFDQVLIDLSRTFEVGEQGTVSSASEATALRLLRDKVFAPRRAAQRMPYVSSTDGRRYASVRAYHQKHYVGPEGGVVNEEPPTAVAARGSLVAA